MKGSPQKHIGCYCIWKVLTKRPGHPHIRSDNCCAWMVMGTYGCIKVLVTLAVCSQSSGKRLIDQFQQDRNSEISTKERFEFYASFKSRFQNEKYMEDSHLRCYRDAYIQFRFGIFPILIHKLRYRKYVIPRNLLCPVCQKEIGDEIHVLFTCKHYDEYKNNVKMPAERVQACRVFI